MSLINGSWLAERLQSQGKLYCRTNEQATVSAKPRSAHPTPHMPHVMRACSDGVILARTSTNYIRRMPSKHGSRSSDSSTVGVANSSSSQSTLRMPSLSTYPSNASASPPRVCQQLPRQATLARLLYLPKAKSKVRSVLWFLR